MIALAKHLALSNFYAVAVVLLHAYSNPVHEARIAEILNQHLPGKTMSLSSVISPKYREYERTSTTVANAYVAPLVDTYLTSLEDSLRQLAVSAGLSVMQSNGGLVTSDLARAFPIRIVESGPAAGVLMCAKVGQEEGFDHVLTFDMGGTTAKLGAIDGGVPAVTPTFEVDAVSYRKGSGLPLNITAIELLEIGAGGGSIARTKMGLITVGPDSSGAEPGPICYGRGGQDPTITDANLALGYLNPAFFNGGAMRLDDGGVADAITARIGEAARPVAGGGGLGHSRHRQRQYGARDADRIDRARPRPPPIYHGSVRRRRSASRLSAGARDGSAARHHTTRCRCRLRARTAGRRSQDGYRADAGGEAERERT